MVNYTNSFENHNFDFLFNFSNQKYDAKYRIASTEYMTRPKKTICVIWVVKGIIQV